MEIKLSNEIHGFKIKQNFILKEMRGLEMKKKKKK
jgi:hypothetical protein